MNGPQFFALDLTNNELFVGNVDNNSVTVYPRTWTVSDTAPLRTLGPAGATGLNKPYGLAVVTTTESIPTLSEWAQIGMVALLVVLGLSSLRRRRAA